MNKNLNRYTKLIILFIVLYPLKLLYKKLNDSIKEKDIKNGYDLVNQFLVNEDTVENIVTGIKPKLWIHISYDKNSRIWESFYSRNTNNLNQAYIYLTIKTMIDKCGSNFDIALVDDNSFEHLLSQDVEKLSNIPNSNRDKIRKHYMIELLHKYGGFIVPPSFLCTKDLIDIYNRGIRDTGCFVFENVSRNSSGKTFFVDSSFIGCVKDNEVIKNFTEYIKSSNKDFSNESSFLNALNVWCNDQVTAKNMSKVDASIIGAKKMNGSPVHLEDILDSTVPDLSKDIYGLYVPVDQVLKRTKYSWFAQLSAEDVLASNTAFTKLLMSSY